MYIIRNFLDGKKTYITAGIVFILGGLKAIGVNVPEDLVVMFLGLMGISLRAGISKM